MKKIAIAVLIALNLAVIGGVVVWFGSRAYPMVGHDYNLFLPYMIDSYLHQKVNGLSIQWYTPSFAGGRPVFPFPEDLQFSLPQFLLWLFNPWIANQASTLIYLAIGFIAAYYFLNKLVELKPAASLLGAVFFTANGFYLNHIAVGHITFQAFPLFAVAAVILTHPRLPSWLAGVLLSFLCAIILYSGIHNAFFFALSALILMPVLYLIKPDLINGKRLLRLGLWGGGLILLLCGSKLLAVNSLMSIFPRVAQDSYKTTFFSGVVGMVHQLLGTMSMAPLYRLLGDPARFITGLVEATGTPYRIWELDASLSPALLLLLAGGAFKYLSRGPDLKNRISRKKLTAEICLALAVWLAVEFTLAKGLLYPLIRDLPLIKSFRVNCRFICVFIFPLSVAGALIFNNWTRSWRSNIKTWSVFAVFNGMALASLWFFHYIPVANQVLNSDLEPIINTYNDIRYQGETFPIETVIPDADPWAVFQARASSLRDPYNTFIKGITTYREILHAGSVYDVQDGYYNLIDPSGYIYPELNGSTLFERIPAADEDKLLDFVNRRQPDWKLPAIQVVFNWISLTTLLLELAAIPVFLLRKKLPFLRRRTQM